MLFFLFSLIGLAVSCTNDKLHAQDRHINLQEYPQVPLTPPYRPLVWGDFNVIHTTDTHGWLLGHQKLTWPEPNYSGDLGDFASFVTHMKQIAIREDVDLLLVDSGDLHDGTGLSDGYLPGGIDGQETNKFLEHLPYDLMTIGNHELYEYEITHDMYKNFAPHLNGRYLTSNVNITVFGPSGKAVNVPVGNRYRKFRTRKGRRVTSLGVIFDFDENAVNTTVQPVADMVKERWFSDAIAEEPDVFVLIGHMPVSNDSWPVVVDAIRVLHASTPILIFGGHTHIRDYQQYDGRTMAMESGRYMETIGWMSADLDSAKGNIHNITFSRRYLDQNRVTYQYHTRTSNSTFDTLFGYHISSGLKKLAASFDLSYLYGTAPHDYFMDQQPYPSSGNLLTLFITEAAPVALAINNTRAGTSNIIIANSGPVRYDLFKGPFTKNDQLTAAPYTDSFLYIPNVTASVANQVLPALNKGSSSAVKRSQTILDTSMSSHAQVESLYRAWLQDMGQHQMEQATNLTLGYVTTDGCPGAGDDTLHAPLPSYPSPDYIGSNPPNVTDATPIDLVFINFIEATVLKILNEAQSETKYTSADVSQYSPTLTNEVLGLYAQAKWN